MHVYPQDTKDKVRILRLVGLSLGQIQREVNIPKTTIHSWISKVNISSKKKEVIKKNALKALQEGRIRFQKLNKNRTKVKEKEFFIKGINRVRELSQREFFIAGIALYWAEGFKNLHERRLGFCNSDPNMLRFYVYWLEKCIGIYKKDLIIRLTLNKSYKEKTKEIEKYWSDILSIPLSQFTKPFYQNSLWRKQYSDNNYHGVLRVHVKDSLECLLEMRGWIGGLKLNLPG